MVEVDETTPEFQSCVTKLFWKKIWDALGMLACAVFGIAAVGCILITVISLLPPPVGGYPAWAPTLFSVGRIGTVIFILLMIVMWIYDMREEAVKECREIYEKK